jgi:hypothetical protein
VVEENIGGKIKLEKLARKQARKQIGMYNRTAEGGESGMPMGQSSRKHRRDELVEAE